MYSSWGWGGSSWARFDTPKDTLGGIYNMYGRQGVTAYNGNNLWIGKENHSGKMDEEYQTHKEQMQTASKPMKNNSHLLGKCRLKQQWDITLNPSDW